MAQYIASKKIKKTTPDKETVLITFVDNTTLRLKNNLFELIVTDKENIGEPIDIIRSVFAGKFIKNMAEYGIDYTEAMHVAKGIENILINAREQAIGQAFGCRDSVDIKLEKLKDFIYR